MNANTLPAPAARPDARNYNVTTDKLELPRGTKFNVAPGPVEAGQLAMIEIGGMETVGRYYSDVAGADWIVQPGLLIQVTGNTPVQVVGPAVPCPLSA